MNGHTLAGFVSVRTLGYVFLEIDILTFIFMKEYRISIYFCFKLKINDKEYYAAIILIVIIIIITGIYNIPGRW